MELSKQDISLDFVGRSSQDVIGLSQHLVDFKERYAHYTMHLIVFWVSLTTISSVIIDTFLICIIQVLVLLSFENMIYTDTNTILTVGIVFQYNTSRIVLL